MNKEEISKNAGTLSLLETGRKAFPQIVSEIRSARQEIIVHMFIWREDRIGIWIAEELLEAANRGVSIVIEKDRYGLLLEYAEESQRSFCHSPTLFERMEIDVLGFAVNGKLRRNRLDTERSELYRKLNGHRNVRMKDDLKTTDHSKYYIFDRRIMILGGINIEDKEYYCDLKGRTYFDYMIRVDGPEYVSRFLEKRDIPTRRSDMFMMNVREPVRCFEMKDSFLKLIDSTERELVIMMAYFAPEKEIMSAISRILKKGASVRILISDSSNFMNDTNRLTAARLLAGKRDGKLSVYMTDHMLHAKLMMNEKRIIAGSCNINQKSFNKLGELCIASDNDDSPFAGQVRESVEKIFSSSTRIVSSADIDYDRFMAAAEMLIMR